MADAHDAVEYHQKRLEAAMKRAEEVSKAEAQLPELRQTRAEADRLLVLAQDQARDARKAVKDAERLLGLTKKKAVSDGADADTPEPTD